MEKFVFGNNFNDPSIENKDPNLVLTFNHYDLKEATESAYQQGYAEGRKNEEILSLEKINFLLQQVNAQCIQLGQTQALQEQEIWQNTMRMTRLILTQLFPTLEANTLWQEFINHFQSVIDTLPKDCHLTLLLNPQCVELFEKWFTNHEGFPHTLNITNDPQLPMWDFRLQWDEGGVERSFHKVKESLNQWLDQWEEQGALKSSNNETQQSYLQDSTDEVSRQTLITDNVTLN